MQSLDALESAAFMKPIEAISSISKDPVLWWMPSNPKKDILPY